MSEIDACAVDEIDEEDVLRFDHNDRTYVIIRMMGDDIYCMDGHCSHEQVHLCDGLVMDHVIECPKHNGRFDVRTGKALAAPVYEHLKTYPVQVRDGRVFVTLES